MIDHHAALIYTMVMVSAADGNMTDAELRIIGDDVDHLPIFRDYDQTRLSDTLRECSELLGGDDGIDEVFRKIKKALPQKLRETAYALACDVVAADGEATQEELQILEHIRHQFNIDRLSAAAIERGTRARFTVL
jgi:tellurite resistance protein